MPLNLKESEENKQENLPKTEPIKHKIKQDLPSSARTILLIIAIAVAVLGVLALFKFGIIGRKTAHREAAAVRPADTINTSEVKAPPPAAQESLARKEAPVKPETAVAKKTEKPKVSKGEITAKPPKGEITAKPPKGEIAAKPPKGEIAAKPLKGEIASKPAEETIKPKIVKAPPKTEGGQYTIFIASFNTKPKADKTASQWGNDKNETFVGEYNVNGATVYRICLGSFKSFQEAKNEAERLKDKLDKGYWIGKIK